jgi:hypothetical protein
LNAAIQVHRLYIVDNANNPVGVVTMSDICKLIHDHVEPGAASSVCAVVVRGPVTATLCAFDGSVLGVSDDDKVVLLRDVPGALWTISPLPVGTQVTFRAASGKYLVRWREGVCFNVLLNLSFHVV